MMSTKRKAEGHSRPAGKLRTMKSGRSRKDSEMDSGFSDVGSVSAADAADSEDSPRAVLGSGSGPQPSQLAVVGGSYSNLSSVIIMNNVLLKQPEENRPALKPWGFSPTVEVVQPVVQQPQVVFLQPVVSRSKEASSKHRRPKKYLPILKSYPKIAPHPGHGHSSSSSGRSTTSSSSSSGYSSSSSGSGKSDFSSHRERSHHRVKHQKRSVSVCSSSSSSPASLPPASSPVPPLLLRCLAAPPLTDSSDPSSPARESPSPAGVSRSGLSPSQCLTPSHRLEDSEAPPLPDLAPCAASAAEEQHDADPNDEPDAKRKRFSNTYNILNKSGLLDITLRTKELLQQNQSTQADLDRLKEQTELFLKALRTGDGSIFVRLLSSFQEEDLEREKETEKAVQTSSTG